MNRTGSFILYTVTRFAFFAINILSLYLLMRGHHHPGGGFIAGLTSSISLLLLALGGDLEEIHRAIRLDPMRLSIAGLLLALATSIAPLFWGKAFLTHYSISIPSVPLLSKISIASVLLFEIGVFLVVVGMTAKIFLVLAYTAEGKAAFVKSEQQLWSSPLEEPLENPSDSFSPGDRHAN